LCGGRPCAGAWPDVLRLSRNPLEAMPEHSAPPRKESHKRDHRARGIDIPQALRSSGNGSACEQRNFMRFGRRTIFGVERNLATCLEILRFRGSFTLHRRVPVLFVLFAGSREHQARLRSHPRQTAAMSPPRHWRRELRRDRARTQGARRSPPH